MRHILYNSILRSANLLGIPLDKVYHEGAERRYLRGCMRKRITLRSLARQQAMNTPLVRAQAFAILAEVYDTSQPYILTRIREHAATRGGWTIAHDLAGLLHMKPDAPWGEEIWS